MTSVPLQITNMLKKESLVHIKKKETDNLIASLRPGHIVQVCGPPMVGKSTVVEQAVDGRNPRKCFTGHKFMCENKNSFHDVLNGIAETLGLQSDSLANEGLVLSSLESSFAQFPNSHHVLVFHKCQSLQKEANMKDGQNKMFLGFLRRVINELSGKFKLSVVLTSIKLFPLTGRNISTIEIGVLSFWDIISILQYHAPKVSALSYVSICHNAIPFPRAVRLFAEACLSHNKHNQSAEVLAEKIFQDEDFLSMVFQNKLEIVGKWIPQDILVGIGNFCHSFGSSFTEEHLEYFSSEQTKLQWPKLLNYLEKSYIVRSQQVSDAYRLFVHPLVIYYWMQRRQCKQLALQGQSSCSTSNRYTDFLCRILHTTEMNMEKRGKKGRVYGCLAQEWPHIRHTVEMALNWDQNTYKSFFKAAVSARGIILRCFSEEAIGIYQALLDCSMKFGNESESAMIEAILGHLKASTVVLAKGGTWKQAEDCLDSAIKKLRRNGPPFALMWAIYRKAIILMRQGKYKEAQMCFNNSKRVTIVEADDSDLERTFGVSKLQVNEDKITRDVFAATVLIFLGDNKLAQEILQDCHQSMISECVDHPELATLLNSIGLIEERGNGNKEEAVKWYLQSYRERQYLAKFNREILVVSLNNIGMIYLRLEKLEKCREYLEEALKIRRDLGWVHAHTALTLTHLGVLNLKCGDFTQAFKHTLDADKILQAILKNHDTRLRINNTLGHLRQLLDIDTCELDDMKLEESAMEYFEHSLEIASRMIGNISDDGYHHLLIAHEHAMLLAVGNSEDKYNAHKKKIRPYFEVTEGVGKKVFAANEKIPNHNGLYSYFSSTDYADIDKKIFVGHLATACEYCQIISSFRTPEELWS